ncbi:hypothetical protein FRB99_001795 [Tulasnella sp. 403]|nr:hypothetical protein FRB99_001795 [Tulasnella sp. 403]
MQFPVILLLALFSVVGVTPSPIKPGIETAQDIPTTVEEHTNAARFARGLPPLPPTPRSPSERALRPRVSPGSKRRDVGEEGPEQ